MVLIKNSPTRKVRMHLLHKASISGELGVFKHLIANGADLKLKDNNGKTAYDNVKEGSVEGLKSYYHTNLMQAGCNKIMDYLQTLPQN